MNDRFKAAVIRVGSFVLGGGLLYLALRGVDFGRVGEDLRTANYWWLIPVVGATLLSHWLRAWRWTFLLDEIPTHPMQPGHKPPRKVPVFGAFAATMIGYLANYAAPRLGEVVRSANVATRYRQPLASVFGTVFTERVLDMATMALAMLTLPLVFAGKLDVIYELLLRPALTWIGALNPLIPAGLVLGTIAGGIALWRYLVTGHGARIAAVLASFRDGLTTIARTPRWGAIIGSTVGMWLCYGAMAYLPFVMFGFDTAFHISFWDAWGIMLLGAVGVVIPSPGGIGSYHYITIQSLMLLFAFPQEEAASYAILTHTGQLLIYVVMGAAFIFGLGLTFSRSAATKDPV